MYKNINLINGQNESCISGDGFAYDMVVAVTQKSLNSTLKQYITGLQKEPFYEAYNTEKEIIDYADILKAINGNVQPGSSDYVDLFKIDANNPNEREQKAIKIARENKLYCAIKARIGKPKDLKITEMHDVIELLTGSDEGEYVYYYAYYAEFDILLINDTGASMQHISQPKDEPWIYKYLVNLDFIQTKFEQLPGEIQEKIKEDYNEKNDFDQTLSIQGLYLKLHDAIIVERPDEILFERIDCDPETRKIVEMFFEKSYARALCKKSEVYLGYTVKEKIYSSNLVEIRPTDYDISISEFSDPKQHDYYTLNYLTVCDNKNLPEQKRPFRWNWVDSTQTQSIDGVMAISRNKILELINSQSWAFLNDLTCNVSATCEASFAKLAFGYRITRTPAQRSYEVSGNGDNIKIEYHHYSDTKSSDTFIPVWGNIESSYKVDSFIELKENTIICTTDVVCYLHINIEGGVSEGNIYNHTITSTTIISVDERGSITFETVDVVDKDNGSSFEISTWSDIVCLGIKDDINKVCQSIANYINEGVEAYKRSLMQRFSNVNGWIFPGSKTFFFKDAIFSKGKDLTASITYRDPSTSKEEND